MNDLKDIGFYTLSDERALNSSVNSYLWRCELILTDECNFKCPYCRGLRDDIKGMLPFDVALETVKLWCNDNLQNVRFSGGEPTLYPQLDILIKYCKEHGVKNIALSTNGYSDKKYYDYLVDCGVTDFSISLDSGCCAIGDKMTGGISGAWEVVTDNIRHLARKVYTTVGVVFTDDNVLNAIETVKFASKLNVSDIRVIPAAQYNKALQMLFSLDDKTLNKYPILKYRINRARKGLHVRGLNNTKKVPCRLVLDDMAVAGGYHFPCIIYMREQGDPIGYIGENMRKERENWMKSTNTHNDKICSEMCLDVCVDYNLKASHINTNKQEGL